MALVCHRPALLERGRADSALCDAARPLDLKYRMSKPEAVDPKSMREAAVLSGVADHLATKRVTIFKIGPSTVFTDPRAQSRQWSIRFEDYEPTWGSIVMGWVGTTNVMRGVGRKLRFNTLEDAILFCKRVGLDNFEVQAPTVQWTDQVYNLYDHKILDRPTETEMERVGPRKAKEMWAHPGAGKSNWQNRRRSSYGKEDWKPSY
jgi:hypothetical protein